MTDTHVWRYKLQSGNGLVVQETCTPDGYYTHRVDAWVTDADGKKLHHNTAFHVQEAVGDWLPVLGEKIAHGI